jgi:ATP-dependent DNA ligase
MKLPTLYKPNARGKIQVFNIETHNNTYSISWGQLDGKLQYKQTVCTGKNIGKSNETTPEQQAELEAKALWTKKCKANYSTNKTAPVTVNLPMKVSKYQDHKSKIKFPCFTSAKLNGVNCEYRLVNGTLKLLSRGGEEYPIPEHQRDEAIKALETLTTESINGEMYIHGEHLQDIMSATKKHNELTPKLKFYVFDFPLVQGTYQARCEECYSLLNKLSLKNIIPINVGVAYDHDDIIDMHQEVTSVGYEGVIIRNPNGLYKYNTRSLDVFKYKTVLDAEFKVVDYNKDKYGHIVWVLETDKGLQFKAKQRGTHEERLAVAKAVNTFIGKWLTVEFEMLSKDGIPLKPVGTTFRDCDPSGDPLE